MLNMNRQNVQNYGHIRRRDPAEPFDLVHRRRHSHLENRDVVRIIFRKVQNRDRNAEMIVVIFDISQNFASRIFENMRRKLFSRRLSGASGDGDGLPSVGNGPPDRPEGMASLPVPHDRARLASDLLASLDSDIVDTAEIDRLWSTETQRRAAMLDSGEAHTVSWDEVEQRFAERRA